MLFVINLPIIKALFAVTLAMITMIILAQFILSKARRTDKYTDWRLQNIAQNSDLWDDIDL